MPSAYPFRKIYLDSTRKPRFGQDHATKVSRGTLDVSDSKGSSGKGFTLIDLAYRPWELHLNANQLKPCNQGEYYMLVIMKSCIYTSIFYFCDSLYSFTRNYDGYWYIIGSHMHMSNVTQFNNKPLIICFYFKWICALRCPWWLNKPKCYNDCNSRKM